MEKSSTFGQGPRMIWTAIIALVIKNSQNDTFLNLFTNYSFGDAETLFVVVGAMKKGPLAYTRNGLH